jgi:L-alanine-DL-glutamate epimerase-like enolase superfamily enzyme
MKIIEVIPALYRIPLRVVLSDSTHGDISHFELIAVRMSTDAGIEGTGYTFTPGTGARPFMPFSRTICASS